jgi:membrane protein required for colicin V production
VLVFLVVQLAVFALIRVLESVIGALKLTAVNRVLGGAVGVFKACLALSVTFLVLGYMDVPSEETKQSSTLYTTVSTLMPKAWDYAATAVPQLEKVSSQFGKEIQEHLPIEPAGASGK